MWARSRSILYALLGLLLWRATAFVAPRVPTPVHSRPRSRGLAVALFGGLFGGAAPKQDTARSEAPTVPVVDSGVKIPKVYTGYDAYFNGELVTQVRRMEKRTRGRGWVGG
jgi:hypothetical protein